MPKPSSTPGGKLHLGQISTQWSAVHDAAQFVVRYAAAIRNFLTALVHDEHDAEDVLQEFLLSVTEKGFPRADPSRGRFRDYLFITVRNAARKYLQRKQTRRTREARAPSPTLPPSQAEETWMSEWHRCIMDRALNALHHHQRQSPGNLAHTTLTVRLEHPDADSAFLAAETSRHCGRTIRPDAYRQHLRRARGLLARFLVDEVVRTLDSPTPQQIEEELIAVGLMAYVRPYLSPPREK
jgi:RNA polymerase sigma-70 factor (ECF subfamily)